MQRTSYLNLLVVHNIMRWIVILPAGWSLLRAYWGWFAQRSWSANDRLAGLLLGVRPDLQVLIGLLFAIFSSLVAFAMCEMGAAMASDSLRSIVVEQLSDILLALVLAHLGAARVRKAEQEQFKHKHAALWFTVSTLALLTGIPWRRPLLRKGGSFLRAGLTVQ